MAKENKLIEQIVDRYDRDCGMLIPMMQDIQTECGYLAQDDLHYLGQRLDIPLSRLYAVVTFYNSFRLSPKGAHEVTLCMGTVCYLKGAPVISEAIIKEFSVEPGGTTNDLLFSFNAVNCVGACALAPVMVVDGQYYDGVTPESALEILHELSTGQEAGETAAKETAT